MSFSSQIAKFGERVEDANNQVLRLSVVDLFSSIVIQTPVDKGTLRRNWRISNSTPDLGFNDLESGDSAQTVINEIQSAARQSTTENDVFFNNNLPYAGRIEFDGHSGKAPQGMVRVNTARWSRIVANNARRVRNAS